MLHREHAAVAMADYHRIRKTAISYPVGRVTIVRDPLGGGLKRGTLGRPTVADRQNIVAAAIERQAGEAHRRQRWWQKPRRTDIEVHRVAVKQKYPAGDCTPVRLVESAV